MMLRHTTIALAAAAALIGCKDRTATPQAQPSAAPSAATAAEDPTAAVKAVESDMLQGYADRDAERVARNYASDARLMSGGEHLDGRDAIKALLKKYMAAPIFSNRYTAERVHASGDLGYVRGHFRTVVGSGDNSQVSEGEYVTVYRKQSDGHWRAVDDINIEAKPTAR